LGAFRIDPTAVDLRFGRLDDEGRGSLIAIMNQPCFDTSFFQGTAHVSDSSTSSDNEFARGLEEDMMEKGPMNEADTNGHGVPRAGDEVERNIENPEVAAAADVRPVALNNNSRRRFLAPAEYELRSRRVVRRRY
jgi:hypothetical protein